MYKVLLLAGPKHFDISKSSAKQNDTILTNVSKMQDLALKYCCLKNCQILSKPKTELYNVEQLDAIRPRWSIHVCALKGRALVTCLVWNKSSDTKLQGSLKNEKPNISQKAAEPCIYNIPNSSLVSSRKLGFCALSGCHWMDLSEVTGENGLESGTSDFQQLHTEEDNASKI